MAVAPPSFVLETALYADDLEAAEWFYGEVLGLEVLFRERGRHVFFRCGTGVVLLFRAEATRQSEDVPPHGTEGAGHVAFAVPADRLDEWGAHFAERGIEVEKDKHWGERGRSLYVRDPAGNSVELVPPTLWGTASRDHWLQQIRPRHEGAPSEKGPVDRFQHSTLRPLIELLTPTLLRLVAVQLKQHSVQFSDLEEEARRDRLRILLDEDEALRHTLRGVLLGHCTEEEIDTYLAHRDEIDRRWFAMLLAGIQEQSDAIAEQIGP